MLFFSTLQYKSIRNKLNKLLSKKFALKQQFLISISIIFILSLICFFIQDQIGYKVVALILLVAVSFVAMLFDIIPVLVTALISALTWNFFFIPPKFTFHIENTEDVLMFLMYFVIALVNAALTYKIKQIEKREQKKEEKENTLRLYNTILNSLSHELRTPISTIIGASDNLIDEPNLLSEKNKKELIQEISKAGIRLNRQVENLLNMSRLESGFIEMKNNWCDLKEIIYGVLSRLNDITKNHTIEVVIPDKVPFVKMDHLLLEQILTNLIANAALHTPNETKISIIIKIENDQLKLVVEDNGPGFPEGSIPRAFDKFYRLNNEVKSGTGLGLSIVKGFVEAQNGTIILNNTETGGAKFSMYFSCELSYLNQLKNE